MYAALKDALIRSWLIFVITAIIAGIAIMIAEGDNPLDSDDPYLAGFLIGGTAAAVMFLSTLFGGTSNRAANYWFSAILLLWCAFLLIVEMLNDGEGDGITGMIAAASFVIGSVGWILVGALAKIHYPKPAVIILTIAGIGLFALYGLACLKMTQRRQEMSLRLDQPMISAAL
jgi:hypothetical protein